MFDRTLRASALEKLKKAPATSDDVHALLSLLDQILKDSPNWDDQDNCYDIRRILSNLSIRIAKGVKTFGMDIQRTPTQKAWFKYGGGREYLNNRDDPLDLTAFKKAMGQGNAGIHGEHEEAEGRGSKGGEAPADEKAQEEGPKQKAEGIHVQADGSRETGDEEELVATGKRAEIVGNRDSQERGHQSGQESEDNESEGGASDSEYIEENAAPAKGSSKKRKSAEVAAEEDNPGDKGSAPKRPRPYTPGKYDPPCDRCAKEGREVCEYDNYGNACRRCKLPSKMACSRSQGTRSSGKPAKRKNEKTVPAVKSSRGVEGSTTGRTPVDAVTMPPAKNPSSSTTATTTSKTEAPKSRGPARGSTKTNEEASSSKSGGPPQRNNTRLKSNTTSKEGEQISHAPEKGGQQAEQDKQGQVLASEGPLGPYLIPNPKPRSVAPGDSMELAVDALRTLGELRESQSYINQRLAEAEGQAAAAIREIKRNARIPVTVESLNGRTDELFRRTSELHEMYEYLEQSLQTAQDNQEKTVNFIDTCVENAKQIKATLSARIQNLEEEIVGGGAKEDERRQKLQEDLHRLREELNERIDSIRDEALAHMKEMKERVKSVEARLQSYEHSSTETKARQTEVMSLVSGAERKGEDIQRTNTRLEEQLGRIETMLGAVVEAAQSNQAVITRRLDAIDTDVRHVKSAMDINSLDLNNLRRTIVCDVRYLQASARERSTQLQDVNANTGDFGYAWGDTTGGPTYPSNSLAQQHGTLDQNGPNVYGMGEHGFNPIPGGLLEALYEPPNLEGAAMHTYMTPSSGQSGLQGTSTAFYHSTTPQPPDISNQGRSTPILPPPEQGSSDEGQLMRAHSPPERSVSQQANPSDEASASGGMRSRQQAHSEEPGSISVLRGKSGGNFVTGPLHSTLDCSTSVSNSEPAVAGQSTIANVDPRSVRVSFAAATARGSSPLSPPPQTPSFHSSNPDNL